MNADMIHSASMVTIPAPLFELVAAGPALVAVGVLVLPFVLTVFDGVDVAGALVRLKTFPALEHKPRTLWTPRRSRVSAVEANAAHDPMKPSNTSGCQVEEA